MDENAEVKVIPGRWVEESPKVRALYFVGRGERGQDVTMARIVTIEKNEVVASVHTVSRGQERSLHADEDSALQWCAERLGA